MIPANMAIASQATPDMLDREGILELSSRYCIFLGIHTTIDQLTVVDDTQL